METRPGRSASQTAAPTTTATLTKNQAVRPRVMCGARSLFRRVLIGTGPEQSGGRLIERGARLVLGETRLGAGQPCRGGLGRLGLQRPDLRYGAFEIPVLEFRFA